MPLHTASANAAAYCTCSMHMLTSSSLCVECACAVDVLCRGLYIGDDVSCFDMAAQLAAKVNFHMVPKPLPKVTAS
jgi:hypothetical protein